MLSLILDLLPLPHLRNVRLSYALVILMGLLLGWKVAYSNQAAWGIDFNQFYAASHLAGTGELYNWDALQREEHKNGLPVRTARLPVVAYGVKAISWLPYRQAQWLWLIASVLSLAAMALLWPRGNGPILFAVLSWSMPVVLLLLLGQDTPFWLLFFAFGFALLQRGRTTLAGVVLALCLCKFHLAAGIPLVLAAKQCWRTLISGGITCAFLLSTGFLIEGSTWPARYMAVFRESAFSPAEERMPNLRGLAHWLPQPVLVQLLLALALAALLVLVARKLDNIGFIAALAAACGLLLAPHGYGNDCALLIPLLAQLLSDKSFPAYARVWALLMATPVPILLLASDSPVAGQVMIVAFVVTVLMAVLLSAKSAESPGAIRSQ